MHNAQYPIECHFNTQFSDSISWHILFLFHLDFSLVHSSYKQIQVIVLLMLPKIECVWVIWCDLLGTNSTPISERDRVNWGIRNRLAASLRSRDEETKHKENKDEALHDEQKHVWWWCWPDVSVSYTKESPFYVF